MEKGIENKVFEKDTVVVLNSPSEGGRLVALHLSTNDSYSCKFKIHNGIRAMTSGGPGRVIFGGIFSPDSDDYGLVTIHLRDCRDDNLVYRYKMMLDRTRVRNAVVRYLEINN